MTNKLSDPDPITLSISSKNIYFRKHSRSIYIYNILAGIILYKFIINIILIVTIM